MKREFAFEDALRMLEVMWSSLPLSNKPARQEELALFECMPELNPVSQPIAFPKRESVYTKVCTLRRQSSSPANSFCDASSDGFHANPSFESFSQESEDDWDDAFIHPTADTG